MRKNLITDHFYNKSSDLFKTISRLKMADIAVHSIDFDAKRINIEKPTADQVIRLGVKAIIASTAGKTEASINGFKINWGASKKIIEIKTSRRGAMA